VAAANGLSYWPLLVYCKVLNADESWPFLACLSDGKFRGEAVLFELANETQNKDGVLCWTWALVPLPLSALIAITACWSLAFNEVSGSVFCLNNPLPRFEAFWAWDNFNPDDCVFISCIGCRICLCIRTEGWFRVIFTMLVGVLVGLIVKVDGGTCENGNIQGLLCVCFWAGFFLTCCYVSW